MELPAWLKGAFKSKAIWFSIATALIGVAQTYSDVLSNLIGPDHWGVVLVVIATISAIIRVVTTTSIPDKVDQKPDSNTASQQTGSTDASK